MNKGIVFIFSLFLTGLLCSPYPQHEEQVFAGRSAAGETALPSSLTVNGISLNDSKTSLYNKLGTPQKVYNKTDISDTLEMHQFAGQNVAMSGGRIKFVMIPKEATHLSVNHVSMQMNREDIERHLGHPNWTAEDGIVYQRGDSVLKVYLDPMTGEIESVELFHQADI